MKKHFSWFVFILVAALSLGVLETSGLDARAREAAALNELQTSLKQKQTQALDTTKLGQFSKIQSLLEFKRGPSSIPNLN